MTFLSSSPSPLEGEGRSPRDAARGPAFAEASAGLVGHLVRRSLGAGGQSRLWRTSFPLKGGSAGILFCVVALLSLSVARAVEPDEVLADPALEARARALTMELRCVVCQNQSVDDSDAPLAKDIRVLVRERIAAGDSDEAVRAFIVARYGKFVLLNPPLDGDTIVLWFGPVALLAGGLALAYFYVRRLSRRGTTVPPLSAAEEDAVERILKDRQ